LLTTDPVVLGVLAVDLSSACRLQHLVVLAGRAVTS
jgi:hypothetical protein